MSKFQKEYFNQIIKLIKNIQKNQKNKISQAAKMIKKTHEKGGLLYLFGTGHSHMLTIEAFFERGVLLEHVQLLIKELILLMELGRQPT